MSLRVLLLDPDGNVIEDLTSNVLSFEMSTTLKPEVYEALFDAYYSHCPGCGAEFVPGVYHACAQPPFEF